MKLRGVCGARRREQWFQQDGAAPHTSKKSIDWITNHFHTQSISRKLDNEWAPCSPDLNPLDYHLWGFLKDTFLGREFATYEELRDAITQRVREIPIEQCNRVIDNFQERIKLCI